MLMPFSPRQARASLFSTIRANSNNYLVDQNGQWSSAAATDYMSTILAQYSEANNNMVELVIANNDEMALGAISALQAAGYNNGRRTRLFRYSELTLPMPHKKRSRAEA